MKQLTAGEIADIVKGEVIGDASRVITGVNSIKEAVNDQLSFVGNDHYKTQLADSSAGVVLVNRGLASEPTSGKTFIVCENVDAAFSEIVKYFAPAPPAYPEGIQPGAIVADSAKIGARVHIGANAVVAEDVVIGDDTIIGAGSYVGEKTVIGNHCLISPNVTIMHRCKLGNNIILHPGVIIGGDGFGFQITDRGIFKIPQTGIVQIDDNVEIGANSTVDRARFGRTWIKHDVKVDNMVMIAHNVIVGEYSILIAQCGIAGSTELEQGVILAAQSGVNGHITVGAGTKLAATSAIAKSCPPKSVLLGLPAEPQREFMTRHAMPRKFERLSNRLKDLEAEIASLKAELKK
ncbi:MAG: UDP-3-O-(3-hydroxymyristoyl)glucosamine N-acyltransferase [Victivallaceae bacterium]|jgi:UDP-3-O-[3-hydroxymyristoyl] glucosamine N-acyltransferase|nr:UDP-3-O-(3-hydroxymyristoyl)glucosamine N-acyltransferase [Victivallaceae bacterium]MDD3116164.1 UDP-3-O-(3-hydroxymyristoyl)glucosamine N-acyltransferase [Victivallaceae bacterium]MDD3702966.1 UDP-3-O-(3-hydroxymyristoyl)glucosamine N-acyltransferase [Victivallaceae bacterium]MDD4317429.1 UDP-3-O-(3-hydroxymyristoyl)glucosamine N-acyltransferase [Victivallaceae bacterium]MDD5663453.1 UDP-3-O-(3-hydroxymyristoyl)glucosamine N-acyltransferase [Victivallaceae bacterium]